MMMLYKLTDEYGQTYNNTQWGENITHSGTGKGNLCGSGWIHAYADPLVAIFLNPIHANFKNPRLWEASGDVARDDGLKVGCRSLTTLREINLPTVTTVQCVRCAILCAQLVLRPGELLKWKQWAEQWLQNKNRTRAAAATTRAAAEAAWAAWPAARAAAAAAGAWAVEEAVKEARAAVKKARAAAAEAAWAAAAEKVADSFDLPTLLRQAVREER